MKERECPGCGNTGHLVSVENAADVYDTGSWRGNTGMMQVSSADILCAWCKAIKIGSSWTRMQTVDSRAQELAQQSSDKSKSDYKDKLTAGEESL